MNHLKKFENINKEDIDYNKIYLYKNKGGYVAIGKIKLINNCYTFYEYYDNHDTFEFGNLIVKIDYSKYYEDDYMRMNSEDFDYLNIAPQDEIKKYNFALASKKFNL